MTKVDGRAQALLRHQVPSGDLAEVLDRTLDALLDKVEARKLGKTSAPRRARTGQAKRYVPRAVRRQVAARDGMQCSFVAADGRRCAETGFLELDHVVPVARGGQASVDGIRVLCRAHNQYEAERILGRDAVAAGRAASRPTGCRQPRRPTAQRHSRSEGAQAKRTWMCSSCPGSWWKRPWSLSGPCGYWNRRSRVAGEMPCWRPSRWKSAWVS
jgi:hypothetical protein